MALQHKPKEEQARLVYSSSPQAAFPEHKDKIFAVIGPFHDFADKEDLQRALLMLMRGWNVKPENE